MNLKKLETMKIIMEFGKQVLSQFRYYDFT